MKKKWPSVSWTWLQVVSIAALVAMLLQTSGNAVSAAGGGAPAADLLSTIERIMAARGDGVPVAVADEDEDEKKLGKAKKGREDDEGDDEDEGGKRRLVVRDKFRDVEETSLTSHTPDNDEVGGGWIEDLFSDFRIIGGRGSGAMEITELGATRIATVDTLLAEFDLSVSITRDVEANETGVVVRYVDPSNYFAVVHDGRWLRLIRVLGGEQTTVKRRPAKKWSNGDTETLGVTLEGDRFTIYLGEREHLSASDSALSGATRAGLYFKSNVQSRFENLEVIALAESPGPEPALPQNPEVLIDSFGSADGTSLDSHVADLAPSTGWEESVGDWSITGGTAVLSSPHGGGDQFAIIPTGVADQTISADITYNGGLAGITWDRADASNFRFIFFDGSQLVLARVSGGTFFEHGRKSLDWSVGQTRRLTVRENGTSVRVYLDDSDIIMHRGIAIPAGSSHNGGFFTRFTTANRFDNFSVRASDPLPQPDPVIAPDPIYVPESPTIPDGAWVFDSFNAYNLTWLQFRSPDLDPSEQGWEVSSGRWFTWNGEASEFSRVYDPLVTDRHALIDTGRDQYQLEVDLTWDGDRIGVLFGGRASSSEDAGQNQFGIWKNGDGRIYLYRWVGGVPYTVGGHWVEPIYVDWKEGQTKKLKVRVEDAVAEITLAGRTLFEFEDEALRYSTWVGLFQRGLHAERFEDFKVSLLPGQEPPDNPPVIHPISDVSLTEGDTVTVSVSSTDPDGDNITLSLNPGSPSFASLQDLGDGTGTISFSPQVGDFGTYIIEVSATTDEAVATTSFSVEVEAFVAPVTLLNDTFTGPDGTELLAHAPDIAPAGSAWSAPSDWGGWKIIGNRATETSLISWADHRAVINSGEADARASVDIEYSSGSAGLTFRYVDELNWLMVWFVNNGGNGQIVLGQLDAGVFSEVDRVNLSDVGLSWAVGETRELLVEYVGANVKVYVDGTLATDQTVTLHQVATKVGLFARSDQPLYFDNFHVETAS